MKSMTPHGITGLERVNVSAVAFDSICLIAVLLGGLLKNEAVQVGISS
jgi:hypothetical protein